MRRIIIGFVLSVVCLSASAATSAQQIGIIMQNGDVRLLVLAPEDTLHVRVAATPPSTGWFRISGTTSLPDFEMLDAEGNILEAESRTDTAGNRLLRVPVTAAGDYVLRISNGPQESYVRVAYDTSIPANPAEERLLFTGDAAQTVFLESFDDNSRGWWLGFAQNVGVTLGDDSTLQQALSGEARTFSGYNDLPGTRSDAYLVEASVQLNGDTDDSIVGLLVRMIDGVNFYAAQIAPERAAWRFMAMEEGIWEPVTDWQVSPQLLTPRGIVTLGVWVRGDVYVVMLDGQPLGYAQDDRHPRGGVGLYAEVVPGGQGAPRFAWEFVRVSRPVPGFPWGDVVLTSALVSSLDEVSAPIPQPQDELTLAARLPGVWMYNAEDGNETMQFTFYADMRFEQRIRRGGDDADETLVEGTWSVDEFGFLVLTVPNLPLQIYDPSFNGAEMRIAGLVDGVFVRLSDAPQ
ncbi:MAG: hypothetical protein ACLFTK_03945 [Anaerolineales bacterium]